MSPDNGLFFDDAGGGGSAIYGPDGKAMAEADGQEEQLAVARIPLAGLRARKRQPVVHSATRNRVVESITTGRPDPRFVGTVPDK